MKHPVTIAGTIVFVGSWAYLLFGIGGDEYRSVVNLHKLAIAHAGIVSGLGMIVAGLVATRFNEPTLGLGRNEPALLPATTDTATRERTMSAEELTAALAEARAKLNKG